jgi:hypothetical protein
MMKILLTNGLSFGEMPTIPLAGSTGLCSLVCRLNQLLSGSGNQSVSQELILHLALACGLAQY